MSRRLVDKSWASRNIYLERGDLLLLLEEPIKPLVTARTRHGRNIRVPLSILTKESVEFNCQLCSHSSFPDYANYTAHLIEEHFRDQLMVGLDNTGCRGGLPSCPFPVCNGTLWGSLEALLMHYASHHHVLEKLMMFESEKQSVKYRATIREYEAKMDEMKEKMADLERRLNDKEAREAARRGDYMEVDVSPPGEEVTIKKEEEKTPDLKTMIKKENATVTNIENQTLKMEFLHIKIEKEKIEKLLEAKTRELELVKEEARTTTEEMSKDQKNTVDMCKQWKEVCLAEEAKHGKDVGALKEELSVRRKEIANLKNIIEIGKATVEHAKQLSIDLAKDNKKRQLKETEYEMHSRTYQARIKKLEEEAQKLRLDLENLSSLVRFQHEELDTKGKEYNQFYDQFKDMSSKYETLLQIVKQKDADIDSLKKTAEHSEADTNFNKSDLEESLNKALYDKQVIEGRCRREHEVLINKLKEKQEMLMNQLDQLQKTEKELRQELQRMKKQLDGHKNLKTLYDNLQKKYSEERDGRESDNAEFHASREHFEEQTNLLLCDLDKLRAEVRQLKEQEVGVQTRIVDLEAELRFKNNYTSQLMEEIKGYKLKIDRFDDISVRLNVKSRLEEELKKKCEKMSAELKVQGWEIENYKNKLISFEMIVADLKELESGKGSRASMSSQLPCINLNSLIGLGTNNNTEKEGYEAEYCEYPNSQDGVVEHTEVKVELPEELDEKDFIPEQRDGTSKREGSVSQDTPDSKKQKK